MLAIVKAIASIPLNDGLVLNPDDSTAEIIRDQDEYSGVRVTLTGQLAAAQLTFHVDVNVGDPVWPAPQTVTLPRLLDGSIRVVGYPLAMVHAESWSLQSSAARRIRVGGTSSTSTPSPGATTSTETN